MKLPIQSSGTIRGRIANFDGSGRTHMGIYSSQLLSMPLLRLATTMLMAPRLPLPPSQPPSCVCFRVCDSQRRNCTPCYCNPPGCGSCI